MKRKTAKRSYTKRNQVLDTTATSAARYFVRFPDFQTITAYNSVEDVQAAINQACFTAPDLDASQFRIFHGTELRVETVPAHVRLTTAALPTAIAAHAIQPERLPKVKAVRVPGGEWKADGRVAEAAERVLAEINTLIVEGQKPTKDRLMTATKLPKGSVENAIDHLVDANMIVREGQARGTHWLPVQSTGSGNGHATIVA